jgi:hypothetical protein
MRSVALFFLFLILSPYVCAQDAGIEGTAIDAITRLPLEGVHVTIYGLRANALPVESYGAISDSDGHFSFVGIRPGKYGLWAQRNGFFHTEKPNSSLVVSSGEHKSGLTVEMTPEAVITGRVVDDYGDPAGVIVRATPVPPNDPDQFVLQDMHSQTDERGQFRIVGAPGKFYVTATPFVQGGPREIRTDGSETPVYGETWYPASDSKERSIVVNAVGGRETPDIEIRLVRKHNLTLSGVVTGIPGATSDKPASAELVLSTKYYNQFFNTDADGRFSLSGLAPDRYILTARTLTTTAPLFSQPVEVPPETTNLDGVNLRLVAGEEVSGTLKIEGKGAHAGVEEKPSVKLEQLVPQNYVAVKGGELDREGAFRIAPVYPGTFRVSVTPLPENAYIKSVQVDGGAPGGDLIDLSRGVAGSKLKIIVSRNGGQIVGTPSTDATIVLAENPDDSRNMTYVAAGKQYRFTGLHPGKYRLMAAARGVLEPDRLQEMFKDAPEIEVHEGDRIIRDIKIPVQEKPGAMP